MEFTQAAKVTRASMYTLLNITTMLLSTRAPNRPGTPLAPKFVTIHNTDNGDKGADALAHAKYIRGSDAIARKVSWHYTVDDQRVVKNLPAEEQGWHAGTHAGNQISIGIEVCENAGIDQQAAFDRAALLTAVLLDAYKIPLSNVVPHQHWSGKYCPHILLDRKNGFAGFVAQVGKYLAAIEG